MKDCTCTLTKLLDELCEDTWVAFDETPVAGSPAAALAHGEFQTVKVPDENGNLIDLKIGGNWWKLGECAAGYALACPVSCRNRMLCSVVEKSGLMQESRVYTVHCTARTFSSAVSSPTA